MTCICHGDGFTDERLERFLATIEPLARGRARATLERCLRFDGIILPRAVYVLRAVERGARVEAARAVSVWGGSRKAPTVEGRRLTFPDGVYMAESDIGSTALDFAAFLTASEGEEVLASCEA